MQDLKRNDISPKLNRYIAPIPLSRIAFAEKKLLEFAEET